MFYVSTVFYLHGVYTATLYITAWLLSDSVFAGMITVALFIVHRYRVISTIKDYIPRDFTYSLLPFEELFYQLQGFHENFNKPGV